MIDELRQIAIFAKTVEHGSFRAAGQALRLSPSVISHHVGQLEQHLGTPLLYRSTRKLSLTSDGRKLLVAANVMLEAAESGLRTISREGEKLSGSLRVTLPALLTYSGLLSNIAEFSNSHTEVQVSVDSSDDYHDIIADGYDVAITHGPVKNSSLNVEKLFQLDRLLVLSPEYAQKQLPPVSPADLVDWHWLEVNPVNHNRIQFQNGRKRVSVSKRRTQISVNNTNALLQLVVSGAGLAVLPRFLVEPHLKTGRLQCVLEEWEIESLEIFAVWPVNATTNGTVKSFVKYLCETATNDSL